jgi:hypothetical protein
MFYENKTKDVLLVLLQPPLYTTLSLTLFPIQSLNFSNILSYHQYNFCRCGIAAYDPIVVVNWQQSEIMTKISNINK